MESGPAGAEASEAAAARAEGNAPLSVESADAADRSTDASTYDPASPRPTAPDNSAENLDEKEQAAREAHGEQPSRHSPHGKL